MSKPGKRRLASTVAALQQRYGEGALRKGSELPTSPTLPAIPTGFDQLDAITGCRGVPLNAITLLSGQMTSGKLTVAYKLLASAQAATRRIGGGYAVALLDLPQSADPDYLQRCGVDLDHLFLIRPTPATHLVQLILDLVKTRQLRLLVVDNLTALTHQRSLARQLASALEQLANLLRGSGCALLFLDEYNPPWLRWLGLDSNRSVRQKAALHIELRHEQWLTEAGELTGYQAAVQICKSRWHTTGRTTTLAIAFNGTVRARSTW